MKHVGLYFGSFNPIHNGHLMVAHYAIEHFNLDEVHFIVSPQNPFKEQKDLLDVKDRLELTAYATMDNPKMLVNKIETKLPIPSHTSNTLKAISAESKDCQFYIIMGLDNFLSLDKWHDVEYILTHNIIVFPRMRNFNEIDVELAFINQLEFLNSKYNNICKVSFAKNAIINNMSSTFIRNEIKNNKSIKYYVPNKVESIINFKNFYK